jgi:hypothetical protein
VTASQILARFAELCEEDLPRPGGGNTTERHRRIFAAGREDLSLAKLAEAHWDAVAILREAGRLPVPHAKYAVWASEIPGKPMQRIDGLLYGSKEFCSGAGLVDRALISAGPLMVEIDLTSHPHRVQIDGSGWQTEAFRATQTSTMTFERYPAEVVAEANWYVERPGFWQGACGPAAAWAGGAAGLVDYAMTTRRDDPHTIAHLAAMHANVWATESLLATAAAEFDAHPAAKAMLRALEVRHLIEQLCTDTLRRFARALGPAPLTKNADISRRYAELDLFQRQSHAERDLESAARLWRR